MEEFEHTDTEARGKQGADVETSCPSGKPELKQMFPGLQFVLVFLRFSREFARDVMPSDGPGEVANFAALTVSLYTTSHHPPVSPDWVRGEQWTPWDSESVSCSRLPGSGSQGLQEIGEGAGSGIQISGLLDVLTPALGQGLLWSRGGEHWAAKAGKLNQQRCLAHMGSWHCLPPGLTQEGQCGVQAVGRGSGDRVSRPPHTLISLGEGSWSFSDNGDCPDTAEAGGAVTGSDQTPGSAGYWASHPTSLGLYLPICEMGKMIVPTTQQ